MVDCWIELSSPPPPIHLALNHVSMSGDLLKVAARRPNLTHSPQTIVVQLFVNFSFFFFKPVFLKYRSSKSEAYLLSLAFMARQKNTYNNYKPLVYGNLPDWAQVSLFKTWVPVAPSFDKVWLHPCTPSRLLGLTLRYYCLKLGSTWIF